MTLLPVDFSKQWDNANAARLVELRGGLMCDFDGKAFENFHRPPPGHFNRRGYMSFRGISLEDVMSCMPAGIIQQHVLPEIG